MSPLILSLEDHPLYADSLLFNLQAALPSADVRHAGTLSDARTIIGSIANVDLVLLDLCLPDACGFDSLIEIRRLCPKTPILVLTAHYDEITVSRGAHFGATGFISKSVGRLELLDSVLRALRGQALPNSRAISTRGLVADAGDRVKSFSPQQIRVLQLICQGLLNKQIAYCLNLSEATVKCHIAEIMQKLGVSTRTQVVAKISRTGESQVDAPAFEKLPAPQKSRSR